MVLKLRGNMTELEQVEAQSAHVVERRKEAEVLCKRNADTIRAANESDIRAQNKDKEELLKAENADLKKKIAIREKYMATPLSEVERVELDGLEAMAQEGHNPDRGNMLRLSELRLRAKNNAKADAEAAEAKAEAKK